MKYLFLIGFLVTTVVAQLKIEEAFPYSFDQPVEITHANDNSNRLFVLSQKGIIHLLRLEGSQGNPASPPSVFLDITDKIIYGGERGLLGLTFHPDFAENGYFFLDYTAANPLRTVIARYQVSGDPNLADPGSELVLMEVAQPFSNHNGGKIEFGPDGYLYISFGDGGSGGDPQNNAQNLSTLLGSIARIDVDNPSNGLNYGIPADNPFAGNTAGYREEIYAYGLRNVWKFSIDEDDGKIIAADVGQNLWEEINIIESGGNYGWRVMEGLHCYLPQVGCDTTGLTLPVWEYGHNSAGGYSITGGMIYKGTNASEIYGKYVYGDFVSGNMWALSLDGGNSLNEFLFDTDYSISAFGRDENWNLYFSSYADGKIYKITGSPITSVGSEKEPAYFLEQNFPNPFNPTTSIRFSTSDREYVRIVVYDTLGNLVDTIYEGFAGPGVKSVEWKPQGLSSGIYYYRLTAGKFTDIRKMVFLK